MKRSNDSVSANLPAVFSYGEARKLGLSEGKIRALLDQDKIQPIAKGLYRRTDDESLIDLDLVEIAHKSRRATLCLISALAHHNLTDIIPPQIDIAIPRGQWRPQTVAPVSWHSFSTATFSVGRRKLALDKTTSIGLYCPQRCIIDAYRLRHSHGSDLAHEALRRWLKRPDSQPADLMQMAIQFPRAEPALRTALEILL